MWPWEKRYTKRSPLVLWRTMWWSLADMFLGIANWCDDEACVMNKDVKASIEKYKPVMEPKV